MRQKPTTLGRRAIVPPRVKSMTDPDPAAPTTKPRDGEPDKPALGVIPPPALDTVTAAAPTPAPAVAAAPANPDPPPPAATPPRPEGTPQR